VSEFTYIFLYTGHLNDLLINSATSGKPIYGDLMSLAESMRAVHGLSVIGRVPVTLVKDVGIGRSKIDTKATCARAQKEAEDVVAKRKRLG
jgi:hypothetical protein